ncbi:MAG: hypothetical protein OHK0024_19370 [Thalassobaculales bacterium]
MPHVEIKLYKGRTPAQKQAAARRIIQVLVEECGATHSHTDVVFQDIERTDWIVGEDPPAGKT